VASRTIAEAHKYAAALHALLLNVFPGAEVRVDLNSQLCSSQIDTSADIDADAVRAMASYLQERGDCR
jgi:hypothetical protein